MTLNEILLYSYISVKSEEPERMENTKEGLLDATGLVYIQTQRDYGSLHRDFMDLYQRESLS